MIYLIKHQERLSRAELLLRTFFGWIYIYLPHYFVLLLVGIAAGLLSFLAWFAILFTGRYPRQFFDFRAGYCRWQIRVLARQFNLTDGYPAFGIGKTDPDVTLEIPYPQSSSRLWLLTKFFFGVFYVGIPHGIILAFLFVGVFFTAFAGWWAILFAGQMPLSFQNYIVGVNRWAMRVQLYMANLSDTYPPFSLK